MGTSFAMTRGTTLPLSLTVTMSGDPYSLESCSLWFTAKRAFTDDDGNAVFQKTIGSGITIIGTGEQGLASILINPEDTSGLSAARTILFWDIKLLDPTSKKFTLASGNLVVNPDVTNV